jgi:hypothetical protein
MLQSFTNDPGAVAAAAGNDLHPTSAAAASTSNIGQETPL